MATTHIFGNSFAYGLYGREADWSSLLKLDAGDRRLRNEQPYVTISNHAGPGNMLVHSLESEQITANVQCNRRGRQLGVFCVGSAESCIVYPRGETKPRRSLADFQRDLSDLTKVIDNLNTDHDKAPFTPMFVSSTPVDEEKARDIWEGEIFNNDRFAEYDAVVRDYASETGADYIDLWPGFDRATMLSTDAVHPNQIGSRFMYEKIGGSVLRSFGLPRISAQNPNLEPLD